MVEGTPLLRAQMVMNCLEGSNPFLSATALPIQSSLWFCPEQGAHECRYGVQSLSAPVACARKRYLGF